MPHQEVKQSDENNIAKMLRAIMLMDIKAAREVLPLIDPNNSDVDSPMAWRLIDIKQNGSTLLHQAVVSSCAAYKQGNNTEIIEMLLNAGANPNRLNHKGYSPLHNCSMVDQLPAAKLLVAHGGYVDQQSVDGYTPLHVAILRQHNDVCAFLLSMKANINLKNQYGEGACDYAIRKQSWTLPMILAERSRMEAEKTLNDILGPDLQDLVLEEEKRLRNPQRDKFIHPQQYL